MTIYIDGGAFPNARKPIIIKQINRLHVETIVMANKKINIGKSEYIKY